MKSPAETDFAALARIRATGGGVQETSYYPALINLLNAVGQTLNRRVLAISQLRDTGAGNSERPRETPLSLWARRAHWNRND